jgi:hypothetical protein
MFTENTLEIISGEKNKYTIFNHILRKRHKTIEKSQDTIKMCSQKLLVNHKLGKKWQKTLKKRKCDEIVQLYNTGHRMSKNIRNKHPYIFMHISRRHD